MNIIMSNYRRYSKRIRQLHTIISQETIKPSSPTPSHLKKHNLSFIDRMTPHFHVPLVFFYNNFTKTDINILKKSLSLTLTNYYPLAGSLTSPSASFIECNDQGVEFLEASNDSQLNDFILKKQQDETLDQLFPNGLGCDAFKTAREMVGVQLNRFACGGAALAMCVSHKIGDGYTIANFINHWATVSRNGSPVNPSFISVSKNDIKIPEFTYSLENNNNNNNNINVEYVTKTFVFPNSKLNELKKKISTNELIPTRVEMLTSLIYKCAVGVLSDQTDRFQRSNLYQVVNMRNKIKNCPEIAPGNIYTLLIAKTANSGELELNEMVSKLRKARTEIKEVGEVEEVDRMFANALTESLEDGHVPSYRFSSNCRFPFYQVDFGWGNPVRVILRAAKNVNMNMTILMDTPDGDGIEAMVNLKREDMDIFEKDKELLAYVEDD